MATSEALNLERISEALRQHDERCTYEVIEIRMNPFEVDRLGWEEILGIPVRGDGKIGTGRFKLVCQREGIAPEAVSAEQAKSVPAGV